MKKIIITAGFIFALAIAFNATNYLHSDPGGAPASNTGAPRATSGNETTCAQSGCHGSSLNSGPHSIALSIGGDSSAFTPGQSYSITVSIVNPTGTAAGFQLVCLDPNRANCGSFTAGTGNKVISGSGRSYLTHTNRNRRFWTFTWNAPMMAPDSVTFYFSGQETVSGSFHTYTNKFVFRKKVVVTGNSELLAKHEILLYPVPAGNQLNISLPDFSLSNEVEILSMDGRLVLNEVLPPGTATVKLDLPANMLPGNYLARVKNEKGYFNRRFVKI